MKYNRSNRKEEVIMKTIIENVRFFQDGTMVFGDLYLEMVM